MKEYNVWVNIQKILIGLANLRKFYFSILTNSRDVTYFRINFVKYMF